MSREQRLEAALREPSPELVERIQTEVRRNNEYGQWASQLHGGWGDDREVATVIRNVLILAADALGEQEATPPEHQAADELTALWDGPDYFGKERQDFVAPEVIHERMRAAASAPQGEAEPPENTVPGWFCGNVGCTVIGPHWHDGGEAQGDSDE